jgi:large subunit ribosomal protein L9
MATMRVILTEEIPTLGDAGEVVTVKAGYGRNYLLPRGKALLATEGRVAELEHQKRTIQEKDRKEVAHLQGLARDLARAELRFEVHASPEGKLFGSVTNADIAGRLAEQGFQLDRRKIGLREPIKQVGDHAISVRLHREVSCALQVHVISKGAPPEETAEEEEEFEAAAEGSTEDESA